MDGEGDVRRTGRVRAGRMLAVVALAGGIAAPTGWTVTDHLERDDDFCNACHLDTGVPLHTEVRRATDARPPTTLAGFHAADAGAEGFRCIDCHGGTSWLGRARVKALAAKDAFWYVVGHFEEPAGMRWPLWDEDCLQCHDLGALQAAVASDWQQPRFHEVALHNVDLGVDCVECHFAHEPAAPSARFLQPVAVRAQCARCHPEYEPENGASQVSMEDLR